MRRAIEDRIRMWGKHPDKPLLLRGARRVGKTYLAEKIGKELAGDNFVRLDFQTDLSLISSLFDGPTDDVDGIMQRVSDFKRQQIRKEHSVVLFDEVQLCERALNSLRFFSSSGWKVIATGSQLGVDIKRRVLPFPSGVTQVTVHPMTFEEFLWALGEDAMASAIREHAEAAEPYAAHREALRLFRTYQVIGGMPAVVAAFASTGSLDEARIEQREIDETYTADMTDPDNGISGVSARRVWRSVPSQLLRASTKKFKYAQVERGGRRAKLIEPIEWLEASGIVSINYRTSSDAAPLVPYDDIEGSFFKVYMADTGIMFYKLGVNPRIWLDEAGQEQVMPSSDFRGALAENGVMQAFVANDLQTFYWMPSNSWKDRGELDFLLQDDLGRVVPVEVKSDRNVKARTFSRFMEHSGAPYGVILSSNDFSRNADGGQAETRSIPLYAAHCLGENCVKTT